MPERIVITGMGTINPLGLTVRAELGQCHPGRLGRRTDHPVRPIRTCWSTSPARSKIFARKSIWTPKKPAAATVSSSLPPWQPGRPSRQSGVQFTEQNSTRVGVLISSAIGGLNATFDIFETLLQVWTAPHQPLLDPHADVERRCQPGDHRLRSARPQLFGRFRLRLGRRCHRPGLAVLARRV